MPVSMLNDTDDDRIKRRDRLLDEIDNSFNKLQAIRLQLLKENLCDSLGLSRVSDQHDCKENCIAEGEDDELSYGDNEYEGSSRCNQRFAMLIKFSLGSSCCNQRVFCFLVCCKAPMATFQYGICICRIALEGVSRVFEFPRFKVCPLCAANLGKDAAEHFMVQHASSLKRRRKCLKSGLRNGGSAMLGKELSSFLGSPTIVRGNAPESLPDPLLSPFLCSGTLSDTKGIQKDDCTNELFVDASVATVWEVASSSGTEVFLSLVYLSQGLAEDAKACVAVHLLALTIDVVLQASYWGFSSDA
ncbi:protein DEHYDRATION-INDUCED 19 [Citrus sinensis]|uniref:Protein DEHYDRATION-INDUCED 19 n=1 Tax=Citrus sinensis TaxID=2711 RepID=A0ACB8LT31_CITSI|nr:protein DEHYDRATION-INDUCED 19 [Citrus sinensis]